MTGYYVDIEKRTQENEYFREILFTSRHIQLVVMSLEPGEEIGLETYLDTDQFICVEEAPAKQFSTDSSTSSSLGRQL